MAAVQQHGFALSYASNALKGDQEVVLAAMNQIFLALEFASAALLTDRGFILTAVQKNGFALSYASVNDRDDPDVVMPAVKQNGLALRYASDAPKDDPKVVLAAVGQNGGALEYASDALKGNREFILVAVQRDPRALAYVPANLKKDPKVVLAAVKENGQALQYAPSALREDRNVMLAAATAIHDPRFDLIKILTIQISTEIDAVLGSAVMVAALSAFTDEAKTDDFDAVTLECERLEKLGDDVVRLSQSVDRMPDGDEKTELDEGLKSLMEKLGGLDTNPCNRHAFEYEFIDRPAAKRQRTAAALARLQLLWNSAGPLSRGGRAPKLAVEAKSWR